LADSFEPSEISFFLANVEILALYIAESSLLKADSYVIKKISFA
jgi:hypothetical protein